MALTPIGMGTMFAGYGIGLTGWCWITGRDISLGQLWNPLHPVTKLPAAGTASPDVIIPNGKGSSGGGTTGTTSTGSSGTTTASGGKGGGSTNPLAGGLSGGSSGAGAATSTSGDGSQGATLTADTTAAPAGTSSTGGTKSSGSSGVRRATVAKPSSGGGGGAPSSGGSGGGAGTGNALPLPAGGSGGVTPADIYRSLIKAGATPVQAAGLMGNIQNESSFNPDVPPGDGGTSFGLFQEHNKAGNTALVTGNPQRDMVAQINFMIAHGGLKAAVGSTPAEVAANFAASYEGCVGCAPGGGQNSARAANAANIYAQAQRGNWGAQPPPAGGSKVQPTGAGKTALARLQSKQLAAIYGPHTPLLRAARGGVKLAPKAKTTAKAKPSLAARATARPLSKPAAAAKAQGRVNPQSVAGRY